MGRSNLFNWSTIVLSLAVIMDPTHMNPLQPNIKSITYLYCYKRSEIAQSNLLWITLNSFKASTLVNYKAY